MAGIILFALGLKGLLGEAAEPSVAPWGLRLPTFHLLVLLGGVALYLLTLVVLGWRGLGNLRLPSAVAVVLLVVLVPVAARLPELIVLGLLGLVVLALTAVQTLVDAPLRRQVRGVALTEQLAAETEQTHWRGQHL